MDLDVSAEQRNALQSAMAARDTAVEQLHHAKRKLGDLKVRQESETGERKRLEAAETEDAATRMLDGDEAASPNLRRQRRLAKLQQSTVAFVAAIRQQGERVATAERDAEAAQRAVDGATFTIVAGWSAGVTVELEGSLATLESTIHTALTIDALRVAATRRLAGAVLPADVAPPRNFAMIMKPFVEAMPGDLRPAGLSNFAEVTVAAEQAASQILQSFK